MRWSALIARSQSGVYYETRPDNPLAANMCRLVQAGVEEFRKQEPERTGMTHTRDTDILGLLVFLQRLELDNNNGRKRGRAYLDFLPGFSPISPWNPPLPARPSSFRNWLRHPP